VVILKGALADGEVMLFDAALGGFDGPVEPAMDQRLAFLHPQLFHDVADPSPAKQPHQIVFQRHVKSAAAGVALPRATAAELAVDAPRFVAFAADHVQPADLGHAFAELDVGAAARHVGRDRDGTALARPGDDFGLALVVFGVENVVRNPLTAQHAREHFTGFDAYRADQHRLPLAMSFDDVLDDGVVFFPARFVDNVVLVLPYTGLVGGDHDD